MTALKYVFCTGGKTNVIITEKVPKMFSVILQAASIFLTTDIVFNRPHYSASG